MQLMPMLRHRSLNKTPSAYINKETNNYNVNVYQQQDYKQTIVPLQGESSARVLRITQRTTQNKPRKDKALKTKRSSRQYQRSSSKNIPSSEIGTSSQQTLPQTISSSRISNQHHRSGSRQSSHNKVKQFKILAAALHAPKKENRPEVEKIIDRKVMTREQYARAVLQSNSVKENSSGEKKKGSSSCLSKYHK